MVGIELNYQSSEDSSTAVLRRRSDSTFLATDKRDHTRHYCSTQHIPPNIHDMASIGIAPVAPRPDPVHCFSARSFAIVASSRAMRTAAAASCRGVLGLRRLEGGERSPVAAGAQRRQALRVAAALGVHPDEQRAEVHPQSAQQRRVLVHSASTPRSRRKQVLRGNGGREDTIAP